MKDIFIEFQHEKPSKNFDKILQSLKLILILGQNIRLLWNPFLDLQSLTTFNRFWRTLSYLSIDTIFSDLDKLFIFVILVLIFISFLILCILIQINL